jgi:hypothetical protein
MSDDDRDPDEVTLDAIRRQRFGVRSALGDLEASVASPAAGRAKEWVAHVIDRAVALRAAFAEHIDATEGPGGLFDEVLGQAPRLANQVNKLRAEHGTISAGLDAVIAARDGEVGDVRAAAVELMGQIVNHRSDGSSLIYEAYFVDIDAAD